MAIYDKAKDAAQILRKADKIEEYRAILDLIDDLYDKREKIEKLKDENENLKEKLQVKDNYSFKNSAYYHKETNDGPYCPRCFDKNKELIRIMPTYVGSNWASCPECENSFNHTGRQDKVETINPDYSDSYM